MPALHGIPPMRYVPMVPMVPAVTPGKGVPSIGTPHRPVGQRRWEMAATFFFVAMLTYTAGGIVCLFWPPWSRTSAGGVTIPNTATCVRASRHADYTTVEVTIGTPARLTSLLLRMDASLANSASSTTAGMQLFAQETVESQTVHCDSSYACSDVMLLAKSPNGAYERYVADFKYRHFENENSVAHELYGVDGELFLRAGKAYWLTATHLCYDDAPADVDADAARDSVAVKVDGTTGALSARRSSIRASPVLRNAPAVDEDLSAECDASSAGSVQLFPNVASLEQYWLSIGDTSLYNNEPVSVDARRSVVEVGKDCAEKLTGLQRDLMLYQLDCQAYSRCIETPSLPFRRLATASLHLAIAADRSGARLSATADGTLGGSMPRLADSDVAFVLSLIKLGMITLAAAVVYVRSSRPQASSSWLFNYCVEKAAECGQDPSDDPNGAPMSSLEDGIIGLCAIVARFGIIMYRREALWEDNQGRVVVTEIAASVLSLLHWLLRYFGLQHDAYEPPLSKLGGSTAIIDATCAVMVAFAEPPTLVVSINKFDPTARLLIALLISIVVMTRSAFSACCCGVLWETENCAERTWYGTALVYSGLTWLFQTAALAILMADLFVTPSSYSMSRLTPGDPLPARLLLYVALMCAGLPRLMLTVRHILAHKAKRKENLD